MIWDVRNGKLKAKAHISLALSTQHSTCFLLVITNKLNDGTSNRTSGVYYLASPPTVDVFPIGGRSSCLSGLEGYGDMKNKVDKPLFVPPLIQPREPWFMVM